MLECKVKNIEINEIQHVKIGSCFSCCGQVALLDNFDDSDVESAFGVDASSLIENRQQHVACGSHETVSSVVDILLFRHLQDPMK